MTRRQRERAPASSASEVAKVLGVEPSDLTSRVAGPGGTPLPNGTFPRIGTVCRGTSMVRALVVMGFALAASDGAALAADLGKGRERPVRELRFDRAPAREHPRRTVHLFDVGHDGGRCRLVRSGRYEVVSCRPVEGQPPHRTSIWRGYPQSR